VSQFDWAPIVRESAGRAGFQPTPTPLRGEAFCLKGEVAPCLQAFFLPIRDTKVGPVAWQGVYLPAFERDWCARMARSRSAAEVDDAPLAIDAMNVAHLGKRPWVSATRLSAADIAAAADWLGRAFDHARRTLPTDLASLISGIQQDSIGGFELWKVRGNPVKVRGLAGWLRLVHGVDVSEPLLRWLPKWATGYDLDAMLEPQDRQGLDS
jgi:hypothetical protein